MSQFAGLKITQDPLAAQNAEYRSLHRVKCDHKTDRLEVGLLGRVGWGGNSGFQALNLAVQFGARRIVLVGYDMRTDKGLHWHRDHPRGMNNPSARNVARWRRVTDEAAEVLRALGIEVFNASPVSALTAYRKMSLTEALSIGDNDVRQALLLSRSAPDGGGDEVDRGQHREQRPQAHIQRDGLGQLRRQRSVHAPD